MAVAEDSGGEKAAGKFYDQAKASYTTLIDTGHLVTELYGMVNVPTGVWIDEDGKIVRPPEVAYSKKLSFLGQTLGDDRYAVGLRDWIAKGDESAFVMSKDKLRPQLVVPDSSRRLADAQFALGVHLHLKGEKDAAREHWQRAQKLAPLNWNYHRQAWRFQGLMGQLKFLDKVGKLEGPYYPPADLPKIGGKN